MPGKARAASVVKLVTAPERLRSEREDVLRQALLPFADDAGEIGDDARGMIAKISRQTATRSKWTFVMLSPDQNAAVVNFLFSHSSRPVVAVKLWAECFRHLNFDTGEIMQTRDQLADSVNETSGNVSRIMSELESFGAISRKRVKVAGMKGQGIVRYFMNPTVCTHLTGIARDDAQKNAPQLRLVE